ncbi:cytochrome c oxidase subunit 4 [Antiquaquibacter soli]|uniref:Cytochrome c oxidase polypeptide 4 n=1 Tax=Antiquaquibacter soli TaxID=3064523 RepID=A0ABT9BLG4_9MICO|nr:cytochrome c oxidase subunit 4 [Protaetiibacter sp. WY-16]MDO7881850.1 cytochrome c oxidase subunit 4 [Protaetiibacter sp. WY-16]
MRTNFRMFWILAGFFFFADIVYTVWYFLSHPDQEHWWLRIEWVGSVAILLTGILAVLIAFYLGLVLRSQGGELPEDRLDADVDDGEAEQGHFSPWSWWPIVLAFSSAIVVLGLAVGPWISFIGVGLLLVAIVGWVYEYYRGYFAR